MIQFSNVSKGYGRQQVLDGVSFTINPGERVGVVGPNGAGKSTIFQILTGLLEPDKGDVSLPGNLRLGHVRQQLHPHKRDGSLLEYTENALPEIQHIEHELEQLEHRLADPNETDGERLLNRLGELQTEYEHLGGYELRSRAEATLCGLGFSPDRLHDSFRSFSGGWQIRAELARVLVSQPDILLLDEPTNYLDVPAVEWLQDFLRAFPGTLILISHDRYLLNCLTRVTLEVSGGQVNRYPGNYNEYLERREARYLQLVAARANYDRKKEQLERFVERFRSKATKASQAQSRLKQLEKMEEVEVPTMAIKAPRIRLPKPPRSGQEVVRTEGLWFAYDEPNWILRDIDMRLERGDRAAFVGLNGAGKTTLLRLLAGRLQPQKGKRVLGHNVEIGYQAQDFADVMDPNGTVYGTARSTAVNHSDGDVRDLLGGFGFPGEAIDKKVEVLSGGEKVRLGLARLLLQPCNFLILDEPTTHLDIQAREALEEALTEYDGTLCLVSHDIEFVRHVATVVYAVGEGGVTKYFGNYEYYRQKLVEAKAEAKAIANASATAAAVAAATESKAAPVQVEEPVVEESAAERRERKRQEAEARKEFARVRKPIEAKIEKAEGLVEKLEAERDRLHEELASGAANLDFAGLTKRLGLVNAELDRWNEMWEAASMELEELRESFGL
jgi:ATP-binding cassette subfamily F protein 3